MFIHKFKNNDPRFISGYQIIITLEPPKRHMGPSYLNRRKGKDFINGLENTIYSQPN